MKWDCTRLIKDLSVFGCVTECAAVALLPFCAAAAAAVFTVCYGLVLFDTAVSVSM